MRYQPAPAGLFIRNRDKLTAKLKPGALVVIHANDVMPTNADGVMPFKQNSNLYYLSGIDQEETILLLFPDATNECDRAILYLRETSEKIRIWEGEKLTKEKATELSGIQTVKWIDSFESDFVRLALETERIYLETNEHARATHKVATRNDRFIEDCRKQFPLHEYDRLAPLLAELRAIKEPQEIAMIRQALSITEVGLRRVMDMLRPDIGEWEVEAELAHEFLRKGSRGFAFTPIVASGTNAISLHYITNDHRCKDGDLVLIDVGAEWGNWNADLTRCYPVNGTFTQRQRVVYDAVLRIQRHAMSILRAGITVKAYDNSVKDYAAEELANLSLISADALRNRSEKNDPVNEFFMHGTSHHLGLDVHDVAPPHLPVAEGMVFTVEPGIYIAEERLGIRLENNVLVNSEGVEDLSANVPIEPEEIEALMAKK